MSITNAPDSATTRPDSTPGHHDQPRVLPLELFSDLVFVFAITQLTTVLVREPTWTGILHVLLPFGMVWWIYGGYIWLTNAVRPDQLTRKLLLLVAMAGFLMMGLAIPRAFNGDGAVFGIGYLLVVLIHTGLFAQASDGNLSGLIRIAPSNLACAALLIVAGFQSAGLETILWAIALAIQVLPPLIGHAAEQFHVEPGHFVERYSLLVLIALGESIVAVGAGGRRLALTAGVVIISVLGLALTGALWWAYFGGDEAAAEDALVAVPEQRRGAVALAAYFYAQIPLILGIVSIAAAIRTALPHPTSQATIGPALLLAGGAAAFLAGDLSFRTALNLPRSLPRLIALPLVLATTFAGLKTSATLQVGLTAAVLIAALVAEKDRR